MGIFKKGASQDAQSKAAEGQSSASAEGLERHLRAGVRDNEELEIDHLEDKTVPTNHQVIAWFRDRPDRGCVVAATWAEARTALRNRNRPRDGVFVEPAPALPTGAEVTRALVDKFSWRPDGRRRLEHTSTGARLRRWWGDEDVITPPMLGLIAEGAQVPLAALEDAVGLTADRDVFDAQKRHFAACEAARRLDEQRRAAAEAAAEARKKADAAAARAQELAAEAAALEGDNAA